MDTVPGISCQCWQLDGSRPLTRRGILQSELNSIVVDALGRSCCLLDDRLLIKGQGYCGVWRGEGEPDFLFSVCSDITEGQPLYGIRSYAYYDSYSSTRVD